MGLAMGSKTADWGTPTQTLGQCSWPSLGAHLSSGVHLMVSSPSGLAIPLVKVIIGFLVHPQSPTWALIHLSHNG